MPSLSSRPFWSMDDDLATVRDACQPIWPQLAGTRIFMTGGTGFIGSWLLEAIRYVNLRDKRNISVSILTRNPDAFAAKAPHLANHEAFSFVAGNVADFASPDGEYTHLIHAATDASADLNENNPLRMFDTVVEGTRRALELATEKKITRTLFMSSGAVYGQQPWEVTHVREDWTGSPDCTNPRNTYAEAKRAAEMLCAIYIKQFDLEISIARIFALLGPYLSLDIHFAAGNFISDAMSGRTVVVKGNGRPCRSYLYASDLTVWLLHLLVRGESGKPYNVGSDETTSIRDLAERVATVIGNGSCKILDEQDSGWNPGRYVPDTSLAARDLGLARTVSLDDAIRRTALWNGWKP